MESYNTAIALNPKSAPYATYQRLSVMDLLIEILKKLDIKRFY